MKCSQLCLLPLFFAASSMLGLAAAEAPASKGGLIKTLVSGTPHQAFFGVAFNQAQGLAVGGGGVIFQSSDSGQSWKPVATQTQVALLAVASQGKYNIVVGQTGAVLVQIAGRWLKTDSGTQSRLFSVSVNNAGLAVASGEFGTLIKSADGGRTWVSIKPDWPTFITDVPGAAEPHLYAVKVGEAGEITVAGEFGLILRSTDGGLNWTVANAASVKSPSIFALHLAETGNSFAVGQSGEILKSANGGQTWEPVQSGTKANLLGVTANAQGQVTITGMRALLLSADDGATWRQVKEGDVTTDWYQAVTTLLPSNRVIAVGHAGRIIQIGI